ncbi:MAG TPA: hypothetical protein VIC27_12775, partial [Ktedonobacterales bacterium]
MSDARKTAAAPATPLTLRQFLAARHAQMALAGAAAAEAPPTDDALLAEAAQAVAQLDLPPEKLTLLRASLADFDAVAAARRLTPTQAQAALTSSASRAARQARSAGDALTVDALDALTPDAWTEFTRWLLEQEGAHIEPRPFSQHAGLTAWRATQGEQALVICAWRLEPGWPLLEDDLRQMAALAAGEPRTRLVIVTTAEATVGARLAALALGEWRIMDRPALAETLATLATAHQREQARTQDEAKIRAKAATAARKKLVAALTALEEQASAAPGAHKVAGRPAVRKAALQVEQAQRLAAQALIAWDTLLADWTAAFAERPARDGSLVFSAAPALYGEMAERADHLKKPLLDALRALAKTPGDGDLGYAAWRLALGEELAARCTALRWRAQLVDPAQWQDFAEAVNDLA